MPAFVSRVAAYGWHWIVRCKINSALRFRDHQGHEWRLGALVAQHVPGPSHRWKARGEVFKKAGWRGASVVVLWAAGHKEPLAVLTDLRPQWEVLAWYGRRFWCEMSKPHCPHRT